MNHQVFRGTLFPFLSYLSIGDSGQTDTNPAHDIVNSSTRRHNYYQHTEANLFHKPNFVKAFLNFALLFLLRLHSLAHYSRKRVR
jgi:hypothetical protein